MAYPDEGKVATDLAPFNNRIRKSITKGFKAAARRSGGSNLFRRTDSAEIYDCVIQAMKTEFDGSPDVQIFEKSGTARFVFGGTVSARLKKANRHGMGQNVQTGANDNFLNPRLPFKDAPDASKVEICWRPNAIGTAPEKIFVTARDGDQMLWQYEMPGGAEKVFEFAEVATAEPEKRKSVVRLKKGAKKASDAS